MLAIAQPTRKQQGKQGWRWSTFIRKEQNSIGFLRRNIILLGEKALGHRMTSDFTAGLSSVPPRARRKETLKQTGDCAKLETLQI